MPIKNILRMTLTDVASLQNEPALIFYTFAGKYPFKDHIIMF